MYLLNEVRGWNKGSIFNSLIINMYKSVYLLIGVLNTTIIFVVLLKSIIS